MWTLSVAATASIFPSGENARAVTADGIDSVTSRAKSSALKDAIVCSPAIMSIRLFTFLELIGKIMSPKYITQFGRSW